VLRVSQTGAPDQTPIALDTKQAMRRSPFASARIRKLCDMSLAWEEAARGAKNISSKADA